MDPMSSLLEDPLYHLTHDIYGFEPLQLPFDFPVEPEHEPEANQTLEQELGQPTTNDTNTTSIVNPPRDEGSIEGHVDDPKMEGGDRKQRRKDREKEKRVMHREVEKQRRQEMTFLHRSLRSLLPAEYLKGKRSVSDHLNEAVKYIRHLKAKNGALRNKLKAGRTDEAGPQCQLGGHADQVVVKACREGVEVLVAVIRDKEEDDANGMAVSTSAVLKALMREGLDVTSCFSTHIHNNKWLHCVQAQVGEGTDVYPELQQNLTKRLSSVQ